ncbi:MAG TPA: methionine--tRNA ligase [Candidatus Bathyarchaeia archaeon]|nr:methionine--tRNA ligase [Candidatus Bathyarchaeia archaeon]
MPFISFWIGSYSFCAIIICIYRSLLLPHFYMNIQKKSYYITTPIYYATAKPHLGSLYSTLLADVLARWHKMLGNSVFMLTGTDEHGQKIADAAQKEQMSPQDFVDRFIPAFKTCWHRYEIQYDRFIRTTDHDHAIGAQKFVTLLIEKGDIYKDVYRGWYCVSCETFVPEKEGERPPCPSCGRVTTWLEEASYFFRLSAYEEKLLQFYNAHPDFILPKERAAEVISFVRAGLKDLSVSRSTVSWGIPFPGDPEQTIYVWVEALCNYLTAIGYGDVQKHDLFAYRWPANMQVIGKDIVRFHAVFWPAFLMAAELPLPKQLLVHGWIQVNQQKMSKSLGNVVDPMKLAEAYGPDAVRYFLLRYIPINQDGEFSTQAVENAINADLAHDLGNLFNRMASLADTHTVLSLERTIFWSPASQDMRDACTTMIEEVTRHMEEGMFHHALTSVWKYIKQVNAYFHHLEPWKLAKTDTKKFQEVLSATANSLYCIGTVLWPFMPKKMEELFAHLGITYEGICPSLDTVRLTLWQSSFLIKKGKQLFVQIEPTPVLAEQEQKIETYQKSEPQKGAEEPAAITIQDFAKVDLRVGTIIACEVVEKSDKLLRLQVDFGPLGKRQILSGIKQWYTPEMLIGKQAIFVCNLAPRMMMGLESHGMLLCVKDETEKLQITAVSEPVANGTPVK